MIWCVEIWIWYEIWGFRFFRDSFYFNLEMGKWIYLEKCRFEIIYSFDCKKL
ncbi:unnamed protein product [Moneuplotes crassus]|uniref:Uncharacterized protein n=1 Tax=Euplotes crassus TaxID=5936 RepID=A0AAD1Y7G4_EUPCR|nr:unnamed protein product [Moneuplotes crassus]